MDDWASCLVPATLDFPRRRGGAARVATSANQSVAPRSTWLDLAMIGRGAKMAAIALAENADPIIQNYNIILGEILVCDVRMFV